VIAARCRVSRAAHDFGMASRPSVWVSLDDQALVVLPGRPPVTDDDRKRTIRHSGGSVDVRRRPR